MTVPSTNSLLHEYRKQTEAAPSAAAWPALEGRLFPPAVTTLPRRTRYLIGSLATALAMAWLVGLAPRLVTSSITTIPSSGAGGSEGTSGRALGRGGDPGSNRI